MPEEENRMLNNTYPKKPTLAVSCCTLILLSGSAFALTSNTLASGTIANSEAFNGPATIKMVQIILNPGDTIPWHYHPGRAYIIVKTGTVTEELGCGGTNQYSAGEALEETTQSVHQLTNMGTTQAELYVTIIVPAGSPTTISTGGPLCGPPTNANQCKDDGWTKFNHPRTFSNQGDCIQYVLTGK
jgi:quercetin dioxygenase-like cupin family protein